MSMAEADPARPLSAPKVAHGELLLRVCSALVLAPIAVGVAYLGGWPFVIFWGAAAVGVLWEWTSLTAAADRQAVFMTGVASVVLAVALTGAVGNADDGVHETRLLAAMTVLAMGALGVTALAPREQRAWVVAGIPYAGLVGIAPILLRSDVRFGLIVTIFLFAVVWASDIAAYFAGRAIGGPKLAPGISPKKTWSGSTAGLAAAIGVALAIGHVAELAGTVALCAVAVLLSVIAQVGDLFESALKRRFDAKDSGHLIPGHGGLMDRLDGFVAAATVAALIGLVRGGLEAPGGGVMVW
jgi:phosphatidate cytidylyltransferase